MRWPKDIPRITTNAPAPCFVCGSIVIRWRRKKHSRIFCSRKCYFSANTREGHIQWQGGRWTEKSKGYVQLNLGPGKRRTEHIIKAEKALGRSLKQGEAVHHIDGNKTNNKNRNLLVCDKSYHAWLHHRMSYLYQQEHFAGKDGYE